MAETETQAEQGFAWDGLFSGLSNVAIAGLGVLEAREQAEPAPVSNAVAQTAVSEATPVPAHVGTNNNGQTVIQPTSTIGGMNQKSMLLVGGITVTGLVLFLALRKK